MLNKQTRRLRAVLRKPYRRHGCVLMPSILIFAFAFLCLCSAGNRKQSSGRQTKIPGVIVNQGRYKIASSIITDQDIQNMQTKLRALGQKRNLKQKAIEALIERALVKKAAHHYAVVVSDARIENEIEKQSVEQGLNRAAFQKKVELEFGLPFPTWSEELRYRLVKSQLIQFVLHVSPPTEKEIRSFYRKNRRRIGLEFRYREIILIPKNTSIKEERRISKLASSLHKRLSANPKAFATIARSASANASPYKRRGGLRPYQSVYEIAFHNPILASVLHNHPLKKIARPFRDSLNRYMIIQVQARRPLAFKRARPMIARQIYAKKQEKKFQEWLAEQKKQQIIQKIL